MGSIESVLAWFQHLAPAGVLGAIFLVAYIENIFPPSPCDVLLVFAGTLIALGTIGFLPAVAAATLGGTLGFMTAYAAGRYFDRRILTGRFARFLPVNTIQQVEKLFQRWGYGVIIANRFLAGTRAVVAFFAGMAAGYVTGVLHTRLRVTELLAGILVMTALYSVNLHVMGRSNVSLLDRATLVTRFHAIGPLAAAAALVLFAAACLAAARHRISCGEGHDQIGQGLSRGVRDRRRRLRCAGAVVARCLVVCDATQRRGVAL